MFQYYSGLSPIPMALVHDKASRLPKVTNRLMSETCRSVRDWTCVIFAGIDAWTCANQARYAGLGERGW